MTKQRIKSNIIFKVTEISKKYQFQQRKREKLKRQYKYKALENIVDLYLNLSIIYIVNKTTLKIFTVYFKISGCMQIIIDTPKNVISKRLKVKR